MSLNRSHREAITGKIDAKNPASAPVVLLIRNAWLSGAREYFDWRSFFSSSKPTSASMIARKPRADEPVSFMSSRPSSLRPATHQKTLLFKAALMISGGA